MSLLCGVRSFVKNPFAARFAVGSLQVLIRGPSTQQGQQQEYGLRGECGNEDMQRTPGRSHGRPHGAHGCGGTDTPPFLSPLGNSRLTGGEAQLLVNGSRSRYDTKSPSLLSTSFP